MKATWSVVVVHENKAAREAAVELCDRLVERFWNNYGFDVTWWPFENLHETTHALEASDKARAADLIIFAASPEGELPEHVCAWVESWLRPRCEREGTLIGLMETAENTASSASHKHVYLRKAAHRAGMDYLTRAPQNIAHLIPDSIDSYTERADCVTSVLDEILHQQTRPTLF